MGRNAQLIRQWAILKQIETNRWTTITDLSGHHIVSTKTIRRDLAALMEAGFPLYDERYDGKVYWRLNEEYKGLPLATSRCRKSLRFTSARNWSSILRLRLFRATSHPPLKKFRERFQSAISSSSTVWTR